MGYLTLRLRGVFFAIATLALAIVLQTLITNWDFVGGSRGVYIIRPAAGAVLRQLHPVSVPGDADPGRAWRWRSRARSSIRQLGYGLATIRDDELAAEAAGVPTLELKLIATTLSGALMGMAGAPLPYYVTYLDPASGFNLPYAVNSIAMPLIGGTASWLGPVIGAVLLGTIQQVATVTISSALNLLIVGVLLVEFVMIAPNGIVGWFGRGAARGGKRVMRGAAPRSTKLGKRFGGFVALDNIDLDVTPGERLGLIGPNGSGKSTLVNCISGTLRNETGTVQFDGRSDGRPAGASAHAARAWRAASSCRSRSAA